MSQLSQIAVGVFEQPGPDDRTPVLCLPGLLGATEVFQPLLPQLRDRRVLLAELPPGDPWRAAAILARRLESMGPFHLLTGSFGGLVAMALPVHLRASIACVATVPGERWLPTTLPLTCGALSKLPAPLVEALYRRHLGRALSELSPAIAQPLAARGLSKDELVGRLMSLKHLPEVPGDTPVLWLMGQDDEQVSWTPQDVEQAHPGSRALVVPGGHRPYATHPQDLVARLQPFWREVEG